MRTRTRASAGRVLGNRDAARDHLMWAALGTGDDARRAWAIYQTEHAQAQPDGIAARWLPLIARNLEAIGEPSSQSPLLRRARREAWVHNQRLLAAAAPVLAALESAGVEAVLLKGAALAVAVYPDRGVRPFGDVDVLVRPDSHASARSILAGLGWTCARPLGALPQTARHSVAFGSRSGVAIDLHQHLLQECAWETSDTGLWQRIECVDDAGSRRRVLAPADQLLHVCVHGLRWSPVHAGTWVADAVEVLRRSGDRLAWDTLVDEARRRQLTFQMSASLRLVASVSGAAVPTNVLTALSQSRVSWADRVECHVKARRRIGPSGLWLFWRGWRRARRHRSDAGGFLRVVAGFVGLDARRQLIPWFVRRLRHRGVHR